MSLLPDKEAVSPFAAPLLVNSASTKKPQAAKKARFARLCMHVIKECATKGNLAMLPVVAYLSLNSYMPEWKYNNAAIQKTTGLDRKTVAKCLTRLEELGVLCPVEYSKYTPSMPRRVKAYTLDLLRFTDLFETIPDEPVFENMGNKSPYMGNESPYMGNKSTLYGDSLPTNRIEIEKGRRKEVIEGDNVLNSHSPDDVDFGDYDLAYYECLSLNEDVGDRDLAYYESLNYQEPSEVYDRPPLSITPVLKVTTTKEGKVVEKLTGKELERFLEDKRLEEDRKAMARMSERAYALYQARKTQYRSPRYDQEDLIVFPPHEKALCLKEGIRSLSLTGIFMDRVIPAPVFADERGVSLAERLFEANPKLTVATLLNALEHLCIILHGNPKEDGKWDDYVVERKCMKLSYFINYLQELVSKYGDNGFNDLTPELTFVTDVVNRPVAEPV